jgi:hypothetical protein
LRCSRPNGGALLLGATTDRVATPSVPPAGAILKFEAPFEDAMAAHPFGKGSIVDVTAGADTT